jgi:hypothetical protein
LPRMVVAVAVAAVVVLTVTTTTTTTTLGKMDKIRQFVAVICGREQDVRCHGSSKSRGLLPYDSSGEQISQSWSKEDEPRKGWWESKGEDFVVALTAARHNFLQACLVCTCLYSIVL